MTWTVEEQTKDGWRRCAMAHAWELNKDAHAQRDELAKRYPKRTFAVKPSDGNDHKYTVWAKVSIRRNGRALGSMEVEMPATSIDDAVKIRRPITDAITNAAVKGMARRKKLASALGKEVKQ